MDIGEFIDTYSDDLITIHEARSAAYTHPLKGDYAFAELLLDASFCRILVVFVVGGIEAMLESWRDRDRFGVLEKYFATNVTNGERVTSLCKAFTDAGIHVDQQVFDDYLAIKYLRNTIIHGRWKEREKDWLDARGFPCDTRQLTKEHLDKIENVNQNMMFYIALTGLADPSAPKPDKLVKLDETITRRTDKTGILRLRDIDRIIWNNLERIDSHLFADIEKSAMSGHFDWTGGRTQPDLDALGHDECKRLFYLAARRAGEEDHELLAQHRELATEALDFWCEYWQRAIAPYEASIQSALAVFTSPDFQPETPEWSLMANIRADDLGRQLVDHILPSTTFTNEQIVDAFRAGEMAYKTVPNVMAAALFTVRLPIVDPANTAVYLREAERALDVLRLRCAWHDCVEHHRRLTEDRLDFYVRMCRDLGQRAA